MERIGVRELKEHASEIMRRVRDQRDMYEITYRGRAIARLVPITEQYQGFGHVLSVQKLVEAWTWSANEPG